MESESQLAEYLARRRAVIEAELIDGVVDRLDEMGKIDAPEDYDVEWPMLPAKYYDENGELVFERTDVENDD